MGLADGTREWRNCSLATARGLNFETSVCLGAEQGYHGIIGVAVDDIAGGRDEVWEQAIMKHFKKNVSVSDTGAIKVWLKQGSRPKLKLKLRLRACLHVCMIAWFSF